MTARAVGVDIGGTGTKAALVDVETGVLLSDRMKVPTPKGGEPEAIVAAVRELLDLFGEHECPIGLTFPAIVENGHTHSAANVSQAWKGLAAEDLFERELGVPITFVNDADAAAVGEQRFGVAKGVPGAVMMTTLGTGIGSGLLYDGILVPNTELGHIRWKGDKPVEKYLSARARERRGISFADWAAELSEFYQHLDRLFSPALFIVAGGVSKRADEWLPFVECAKPIVVGALKNNSGIIGAARLAHEAA